MNLRTIARDALLLWGATFATGLVIAALFGPSSQYISLVMLSIVLVNVLIAVVIFGISAWLAGVRRWPHLLLVALLFWLLSAVSLLSSEVSWRSWLLSAVAVLFAMCVGGGLASSIAPQRGRQSGMARRAVSGRRRESPQATSGRPSS